MPKNEGLNLLRISKPNEREESEPLENANGNSVSVPKPETDWDALRDRLVPAKNGGKLKQGNKGNVGGMRYSEVLRKRSRHVFAKWLKWAAKEMEQEEVNPKTAAVIGNVTAKVGFPANALQEGVIPGVILLPVPDLAMAQQQQELKRLAQAREIGVVDLTGTQDPPVQDEE